MSNLEGEGDKEGKKGTGIGGMLDSCVDDKGVLECGLVDMGMCVEVLDGSKVGELTLEGTIEGTMGKVKGGAPKFCTPEFCTSEGAGTVS